MLKLLSPTGIITYTLLALAAFVVLVGGVEVLVDPNNMRPGGPFESYLSILKGVALSLGALGIGRGIHLGLTNHGQSVSPSFNADPSDRAGATDHPNAASAP